LSCEGFWRMQRPEISWLFFDLSTGE